MRLSVFLILAAALVCVSSTQPLTAHAQEGAPAEQVYIKKSVVLDLVESSTEVHPWTGLSSPTQTITIKVLEGPEKGREATFENNSPTQVEEGEIIYTRHGFGGFDPETWYVSDPYRLDVLMWVGIAFVVLLLVFGGLQGIRGLASLAGSLILIFYILIPNIYNGHSPILVSIGVASLIIVVGSYITHGFNRTTTLAMLGMILTVIVTGIATYFVIYAAQLTGYTSEENAYLMFNTGGRIDMIGLLFGGIMIGLLGILYDIAIGQAVTVEELVAAGKHYTRTQILARAMRVGREHIGALVNTLAIAYVGASLPLLLLFQNAEAGSILHIINSELFATEIVRILMGSIGLVIAVPITTTLATYLLHGREIKHSIGHKGHSH